MSPGEQMVPYNSSALQTIPKCLLDTVIRMPILFWFQHADFCFTGSWRQSMADPRTVILVAAEIPIWLLVKS